MDVTDIAMGGGGALVLQTLWSRFVHSSADAERREEEGERSALAEISKGVSELKTKVELTNALIAERERVTTGALGTLEKRIESNERRIDDLEEFMISTRATEGGPRRRRRR